MPTVPANFASQPEPAPPRPPEPDLRAGEREAWKKRDHAAIALDLNGTGGALVCKDYRSLTAAFDRAMRYTEAVMRSQATRGQSELIDGAPIKPNLFAYGCTLFPAGAPLTVNIGGPVPIVKDPNVGGGFALGTTLPAMFRITDPRP